MDTRGVKHILTLHAIVNDETSSKELVEIKQKVRVYLNQFGDIHSTIEFEWSSENCKDNSLSY